MNSNICNSSLSSGKVNFQQLETREEKIKLDFVAKDKACE